MRDGTHKESNSDAAENGYVASVSHLQWTHYQDIFILFTPRKTWVNESQKDIWIYFCELEIILTIHQSFVELYA